MPFGTRKVSMEELGGNYHRPGLIIGIKLKCSGEVVVEATGWAGKDVYTAKLQTNLLIYLGLIWYEPGKMDGRRMEIVKNSKGTGEG